jgi:superfamily II RNA helicase
MPILREMTELLFSRGFIKILFCTETMSVGINLPVKTTIFTDVNKYNGDVMRMLYSHEYTQAAGRAGRLGLDTVGHVIHLNNLFRNVDSINYKTMMNGKPQTLVSKFKISYNLLLNLINIGETDYTKYVKKSMIQGDIDASVKAYVEQIGKLENELHNMTLIINKCKTPIKIVEDYIELKAKRLQSVNKKRKEVERGLQNILEQYRDVEKDVEIVTKYGLKRGEIEDLTAKIKDIEMSLSSNIDKVINLLRQSEFINDENILTVKGLIATNLREVHCLIFADLIESKKLQKFGAKELVGILSCFANISVPDEKSDLLPISNNILLKDFVQEISDMHFKQFNIELQNHINTGIDYSMQFDLIDYSIKWCECKNDVECKQLLQEISVEKEVFLGEFIKAILKINNIVIEMEKVAEIIGDIEFLAVLRQIPELTLKYVATNQSLYV